MIINSCAKINIGLNVINQRNDGYHNIQTVFYPISLCDEISINIDTTLSQPYRLQLVGSKVTDYDEDNIIIKLLHLLRSEFPEITPIDIYLKKRIPSGAGLGGGSSNAAFFMKGINELFDLGLSTQQMQQRISLLGADCAFFIEPKPSFAEGIGELLSPCQVNLKGLYLVLVKSKDFVSTAIAYSKLSPKQPKCSLQELIKLPISEWKGNILNDFEESVFREYPSIEAIKETLYDMGAVFALMSGSGSTVFALFKNKQPELQKVFSDCFVYQSLIRDF